MNNRMTIKKINNILKTKKVSCCEITRKYLDEISKENKSLNAYVTVTEDVAMKTAKAVDEKIQRKEEIGQLEGVPMTLKDNVSTKNIRTTSCSKMLKDYVPTYDATVWSILKKQNAVLLGKTNMDEFALGSSCRTSFFGGALNPYDKKCVAGGSSGGGACAVGGNVATYAIGSDTGGSIREPASFCGVVGLKPTYGTISRFGVLPYASSLDQVGPITANVQDAAIVFDALSLKDEKDPSSTGNLGQQTFGLLNNSIKGMKIGIVKQYFDNASDQVHKSVEDAIRLYKELGAQIIYLDLPIVKHALPIYYVISCAEGCSNFARFYNCPDQFSDFNDFQKMVCKSRSEGLGDEVKRRILLGTFMLSGDNFKNYYEKAIKIKQKIVTAFEEVFKKCDVIVSPTATKPAFSVDHKYDDPVEGYMADICTVPVNIIGSCAISVPSGFSDGGLPIGLQIVGDKFCEAKILNVAYQFEKNVEYQNYRQVNTGVTI